jgi:glycolate oxidase iron-sulfur subunit
MRAASSEACNVNSSTQPSEASGAGAPRGFDDLIGDCVHCGFCLPACPTYKSWGNEMDSPRGRIDLMKGLSSGVLVLDETVTAHFDRCLACMACVTACPSGVRYDLLIEAQRAKLEVSAPRTFADRVFRELIFAFFPYPNRLKAASVPLLFYAKSGLQMLVRRSGLLARLPLRLAQLEALSPSVRISDLRTPLPEFTAARTERARGRVALIAGCVQRSFFPNVNAATIRVLAAEGYDVLVPPSQGCCGALSLHSGRAGEAKRFARTLIRRFARENVDAILINAAGCGSTLKQYAEIFAGEPKLRDAARAFSDTVQDINEFVASIEPIAPRQPIAMRVAYHDACHLAHAQRITAQPRALLRGIPGVELLEIPDGGQCCGSAGTYNMFEPASAREIGERKAENLLSVKPDLLASANPGCTVQIQSILRSRGAKLPAAHPIEILDASIAGRKLNAFRNA